MILLLMMIVQIGRSALRMAAIDVIIVEWPIRGGRGRRTVFAERLVDEGAVGGKTRVAMVVGMMRMMMRGPDVLCVGWILKG